MKSVVLGEAVVSILKRAEAAEIILCEEDGGQLRVSKVLPDTYLISSEVLVGVLYFALTADLPIKER